jgi:hypothetical protein
MENGTMTSLTREDIRQTVLSIQDGGDVDAVMLFKLGKLFDNVEQVDGLPTSTFTVLLSGMFGTVGPMMNMVERLGFDVEAEWSLKTGQWFVKLIPADNSGIGGGHAYSKSMSRALLAALIRSRVNAK